MSLMLHCFLWCRTASAWARGSRAGVPTTPLCCTTTTAPAGGRSSNCPSPSTDSAAPTCASSSATAPVSAPKQPQLLPLPATSGWGCHCVQSRRERPTWDTVMGHCWAAFAEFIKQCTKNTVNDQCRAKHFVDVCPCCSFVVFFCRMFSLQYKQIRFCYVWHVSVWFEACQSSI